MPVLEGALLGLLCSQAFLGRDLLIQSAPFGGVPLLGECLSSVSNCFPSVLAPASSQKPEFPGAVGSIAGLVLGGCGSCSDLEEDADSQLILAKLEWIAQNCI